jgi:hypothetical protein
MGYSSPSPIGRGSRPLSKRAKKRERADPLKIPLSVDDALRAAMEVPPEKPRKPRRKKRKPPAK